MQKRITNDIVQILEYETACMTPRKVLQVNTDDDTSTIIVGEIIFTITKNYPFQPPIIYIKDQSYIKFVVPQNIHIRRLYDKLLSNCCLWCQSIIHTNNWTPSNRLFTILLEIEQVNQMKRTIKEILTYRRYVSIICDKYNLPMNRDLQLYLYDRIL